MIRSKTEDVNAPQYGKYGVIGEEKLN